MAEKGGRMNDMEKDEEEEGRQIVEALAHIDLEAVISMQEP